MTARRQNETDRFKGPAKYAEYLVARVLVSSLQRLPIRFAYRLGRGIGWLAWKTLKRRRATVRKNLEVVNAWMLQRAEGGDLRSEALNLQVSVLRSQPSKKGFKPHPSSDPSLESQIREVFLRSGANLFAGFTFNRMTPEQVGKHIRIVGLEHLKTALAGGRGAIILLAHMGPWEALSQLPGLAHKHGIQAPFGAMFRPLNNRYLDDWFKAEREGQGTRLFSRRDGFHKPVDFLRSGGMLGILSDQKMREGPKVPYFGVITPTSPVAGLFKRRSGAAMLAVSVETLAPAEWQITIHPVEWPEVIAPKDRAMPTRACNAALEQALAKSPLDGFWLHERFR